MLISERETILLTVLYALGFSARTRRKAGLASAAAEVPRDCDGTRADGVALRCWRATCAAIQQLRSEWVQLRSILSTPRISKSGSASP